MAGALILADCPDATVRVARRHRQPHVRHLFPRPCRAAAQVGEGIDREDKGPRRAKAEPIVSTRETSFIAARRRSESLCNMDSTIRIGKCVNGQMRLRRRRS